MQLADANRHVNQEISPTIYAALVDSMCQNFWPMFTGTLCATAAALMTALKTGIPWIWPCAIMIIVVGTARSFWMLRYEKRSETLSFAQAKVWEARYRVGAVLYASGLGLWCVVVLL